jgi:hypothetical protein
MNNYLVVPGGIVAMKSRIAVGYSSQFSNCRFPPDRKQHSRHETRDKTRDLTKHPLLRMTCKKVWRRDATNALFSREKKQARVSITTAGRRIPKSERQFRSSVSIEYRMTHENRVWVNLHYILRLGNSVVCNSAVGNRRQPAFVPAVGSCTSHDFHD